MIHLITGGSGSGKSAYAEDVVLKLGEKRRIYIATMHPFDNESIIRIEKHRSMRKGKGFETMECYTHVERLKIPKDANVLLECMSNLTANEMYEPEGAGKETVECICRGVKILAEQSENLVIVTNEIASDAQPYSAQTLKYIENLGYINRYLAQLADRVTEVVYGIPIVIKGAEDENHVE